MITLGIDVGGTTVKAGALQDGQVLWTARSARYVRPTTQQIKSAVDQACANFSGKVDGVGLCVPGLLDDARETVTYAANLPGLDGVRLRDIAAPAADLNVPLVVVNDASATAFDLSARWNLSGRLLVLAIGTGVGASVLDDSRPLYVEGASPGHIGQIDISLEGTNVVAPDGGRGGLEGYIGAAAMKKYYGPDPASKVRPGDPAFRALVRALRICHALYRPHHVALAGGVGIRLNHLLDELGCAIREQLTSLARPGWTLACGDSDFHAAVGAARIAASPAWPQQTQ